MSWKIHSKGAIASLADLDLLAVGLKEAGPSVVGLEGPLGVGKTALVKSFAKLLAPQLVAKSPSFAIHSSYSRQIEHFDLYRLDEANQETLLEVGYYEALENAEQQKAWVFVEWPERAKDFDLLRLTSKVTLSFASETNRSYSWWIYKK